MTERNSEADIKLELLRTMILIRRFEERCSMQYGLRKIGGFLHLYTGQEAVGVGAISCLDLEKDYVFQTYRDHGHALAMGMDPNMLMAELFGKATGCSRGKGGSMHFFSAEKHLMGGNGIVGAHIPLAAGAALSIRYQEKDGVVLCFFGDGAIHQGAFHEALNLSKVWELPVVFICENNQWGMGTHFGRVSAVKEYSKMAASYGFPGVAMDGMDIDDVRRVVGEAVERARSEHIPTLIDAQTYRYVGHSISDPQKYRTKDEVKEKREQDPIKILKGRLIEGESLTEELYQQMEAEAKKIVDASVKFAEESPQPAPEELYTDVLV